MTVWNWRHSWKILLKYRVRYTILKVSIYFSVYFDFLSFFSTGEFNIRATVSLSTRNSDVSTIDSCCMYLRDVCYRDLSIWIKPRNWRCLWVGSREKSSFRWNKIIGVSSMWHLKYFKDTSSYIFGVNGQTFQKYSTRSKYLNCVLAIKMITLTSVIALFMYYKYHYEGTTTINQKLL